MKLVRARVTNFRSAEDSGEFTLDSVTCLVGKNEAGKSAMLLAIAALNPHPSTPVALDRERDYPRRFLTQYIQRHPKTSAVAVSTDWQLTNSEVDEVEAELGEGALKASLVTIERAYGSDKPSWMIDVDLKRVVENALATCEIEETQLAVLRSAANTTQLIEKLASVPSPSQDQQNLLARLREYGNFTAKATKILSRHFPAFMYFSNYDRMDGAVRLEQLRAWKSNGEINREDRNGARLFMEFLDYAGVPIDDILSIGTYETFNAKLQAASNNITDQILEYWTQNPDLSVEVKIDPARPNDPPPLNEGTIGRARIYNGLHRVDTPFSERSAGFVWFFSFLVKFAQVKKQGAPIILLLDEPGLTLHGKAQGDLLRYFDEKLAPHHQIIYTTHSPFMVAPDKLTSARIVEDQVELKAGRRVPIGTKVLEDVLTTDKDTLFPLQGALGYEITQSLFIGKHTLLVEGASDILYLQALSQALKSRRREGLDVRWTLCPSGGIGNVKAFVSLFGGNKLDVTVLADNTKPDAKKIEELRRGQILKTERVFTISGFTNKVESDIEDLFDPDLYVLIVNSAFQLPPANTLTVQSLEAADATTIRLVKKTEAAFRIMPQEIPTYDHYTPSAWLIRNPQVLEGDNPAIVATLDRAEAMFKALNGVL